jgi:hypothetical protein
MASEIAQWTGAEEMAIPFCAGERKLVKGKKMVVIGPRLRPGKDS